MVFCLGLVSVEQGFFSTTGGGRTSIAVLPVHVPDSRTDTSVGPVLAGLRHPVCLSIIFFFFLFFDFDILFLSAENGRVAFFVLAAPFVLGRT